MKAPDNAQDIATMPRTSWWLNKTREELHAAIAKEEARMRASKAGGSQYGQGAGVLVDVIRNGFNRERA